jgi:SAM-dependent methyltransferase
VTDTGAGDYAERYAAFPAGFFDRPDTDDEAFYGPPRLVTHIDDGAIAAVGAMYGEFGFDGVVLDLMSSWISHFGTAPAELVALGMNADELAANSHASSWVRHALNRDPVLPFEDGTFDAAVCCVSVDYLARPLEVFDEVHRVLKPGGRFVNSFSNRCFPTKVINGWTSTDDRGHVAIVGTYYERTGPWEGLTAELRNPDHRGDPMYAVWADKPAQ